jgi:hypothetical protein
MIDPKNTNSKTVVSTDKDKLRKRIDALLMAQLGNQSLVTEWWTRPNRYFFEQTPNQAWETDPLSVYTYVRNSCDYIIG